MKLFKKNFCSSDDKHAMEKLDVFLRKFMIRRTHLDTLFNARLLDLPQPKEMIVWLEFNEIERNIYEIVKARFVKRINCISRAGELDKQYGHIWTMLLRLRQLTSHILLVQGTMVDLLEREDFERLHKIASDDLSEESEALLIHLREKLRDGVGVPRIDGREGATIVTETETIPNYRAGFDAGAHSVGGAHGLTYKFDRYLDNLLNSESWEAIASRTLCCGCRQPPDDPMVTSCFHIYCFACLQDLQNGFARRAMERHRCTECGSYYTEAKRCQTSLDKFSGAYDNMTGSADDEKVALTGKSKNKKSNLQNWLNMRGEVLPSAKTIAVKAQVLEWIEEDPTVKIIVYSQWIPMLHVLGRICQTEGWEFEKYTGHMSHESRNKAIKSFGDPLKGKRILLASLKCGGLGLNLTMANRVLQLDPWWNQAVEQQAFCRVFRIGQQKEAHMARLCVKNTIDQASKFRKTIPV
jgi:SNF2 family DNA or RNA helicase